MIWMQPACFPSLHSMVLKNLILLICASVFNFINAWWFLRSIYWLIVIPMHLKDCTSGMFRELCITPMFPLLFRILRMPDLISLWSSYSSFTIVHYIRSSFVLRYVDTYSYNIIRICSFKDIFSFEFS